jgi:hypothetical protein
MTGSPGRPDRPTSLLLPLIRATTAILAGVVLLATLTPCRADAEGRPIAGHIEGYNDALRDDVDEDTTAYELHRPEGPPVKKLPLLLELRDGDSLRVNHPDGYVDVRLTTNKRIEVKHESKCSKGTATDPEIVCSPYEVQAALNAPTMVSNLLNRVFNMIIDRRQYERHALTLGIRGGEPLDLPLLWADENDVVAGSRPLAVSWVGGEAPFAVEIGREDGATVVAKEAIDGQVLQPVTVALTPGEWRVVVRGAEGEAVQGRFTVVPASELPQAPPDAGLEALPEALRESAYAAWLAEQDDGRWLYEAYLRAGALAGNFEPAGYLERYLASGALWQ